MTFYTADHNRAQIEAGIMEVGNWTYGKVNLYAPAKGDNGKLKIGRYTSIAHGVTVMLGGNHRTDWITTYPFAAIGKPQVRHIKDHTTTKGDVAIGSDVWLGRECMIMSGVTIGDGAVVAARSVVTKDVEPYTIVGGNPAKAIRKRFDDATIARLLHVQWWSWDDKLINAVLPVLQSGDLDRLFEIYEENPDLSGYVQA